MYSAAIVTILATLTPLTLANWAPGKAAQINFYTDKKCSAYNGETASYYSKFPHVGYTGSRAGAAQAECWNIKMPDNSKSLNTAAIWTYTSGNNPGPWSGRCEFNDGLDCKGKNWAFSGNPTNYDGTNTCVPARSKDGWLWKSAKCYVN